jgi:hypothetical protein
MSEISKAAVTPKEKTCCVAGHSDIPPGEVEHVKTELSRKISQAVEDGYLHFLTDFAEGTGQLFAQAVDEARHGNDALCLEAVLPYRGRHEELLGDETCKPLLSVCADVSFSGEDDTPECRAVNRREQLRRSSRMILVYDGREGGGTFESIRMGHDQRINIREIPLGL